MEMLSTRYRVADHTDHTRSVGIYRIHFPTTDLHRGTNHGVGGIVVYDIVR